MVKEGVTIKVNTSDLVSVQDAAKELGRPRITIYRWIEAGKIIGIKLGGIIFIPKSEVKRLRSKNTQAANSAAWAEVIWGWITSTYLFILAYLKPLDNK